MTNGLAGKLEVGKPVYVSPKAAGLERLLASKDLILVTVNYPFLKVNIPVEEDLVNVDLP